MSIEAKFLNKILETQSKISEISLITTLASLWRYMDGSTYMGGSN